MSAAEETDTKLLQRWRRCRGAAAKTGATMGQLARARDWCTRVRRDALGGRTGRRTAFPPHPPAARGETSGSGPDDGCRGRGSDPPGAVRRRTRRRLLGADEQEREAAGPRRASDAEGSSGSPRPA